MSPGAYLALGDPSEIITGNFPPVQVEKKGSSGMRGLGWGSILKPQSLKQELCRSSSLLCGAAKRGRRGGGSDASSPGACYHGERQRGMRMESPRKKIK